MRRVALAISAGLLLSPVLFAQQPAILVRPVTAPATQTRPQRPAGVIVGTVVDALTGRGVPKAIVTVAGPGVVRRQRTDEQGRFYAVALPSGDFSITATMTGFYEGAYGRLRPNGELLPLALGDGQWIVDVKLQLWRMASLSGSVFDELNEPIVGVRVKAAKRQLLNGRVTLTPTGEAFTDDVGSFRIANLQPGDYVVSVPSMQVSLPVATLDGVAASGSVTLDMLTVLNHNGPLTTEDLIVDPIGTHVLVAAQSALPPTGVGEKMFAYPAAYYPAADIPSLSQPIALGTGEQRQSVVFQLRPVETGRVSGVVSARDGQVSGRLLRLVPFYGEDLGLGTETALTLSAPDGKFTFLNVPFGKYFLESRPTSAIATVAPPEGAEDPGASARPVIWGDAIVSVDGNVENVSLELHEGATLRGRVSFDGTSRRPSSAELASVVIVLDGEAGLGSSVPPIKPDAAGNFMVRDIVPGRYAMRVSAQVAPWQLRSAIAQGRDATTAPIELSIGEDENVVVTFTDKPTRVRGIVWDTRGFLRAQTATVILFPTDSRVMSEFGASARRVRSVRAAANGLFSLDGLPPGDYYLVAIDESTAENWREPRALEALRGLATRITLREGDQRDFDLKITAKR